MLKKVFALLVVLCLPAVARAEVALNSNNFPDETFLAFVSSTSIDKNADGLLSDEELDAVTSIQVLHMGITSLKGIEHFTALKSLDCNYNRIESLDLRGNTELELLFCISNDMKSINLSGVSKLKELYCYLNAIEALDLSSQTELVSFDCQVNQLRTLDLSRNTKLVFLDCSDNNLTALDITNNKELRWLYCHDINLSALDTRGLEHLTRLWCWDDGLTSLNVNAGIRSLRASGNNIQTLDFNGKGSLTELFLDGNNALNNSAVNLESHFPLNVTEREGKFLVDFNDVADGENITLVTAYDSDGRAIALDSYSYIHEENATAVFAERPSRVSYVYDTGLSNVKLTVNFGDESFSSSSGCNSGASLIILLALVSLRKHRV